MYPCYPWNVNEREINETSLQACFVLLICVHSFDVFLFWLLMYIRFPRLHISVFIYDFLVVLIFCIVRPQEIDEAARRRLVKRLYIPLPDAGAREQIISSLLSQQKCSLSGQETRHIVERTQGM